ncbi:MAG: hypothetical protein WA706_08445, partial [Pseudolabrys sp.]
IFISTPRDLHAAKKALCLSVSLRRECLDQVVIFGEAHLRRILSAYASYYNQVRTHLALQKDAPFHRTAQRSGTIVAIPILAGLHHEYARI